MLAIGLGSYMGIWGKVTLLMKQTWLSDYVYFVHTTDLQYTDQWCKCIALVSLFLITSSYTAVPLPGPFQTSSIKLIANLDKQHNFTLKSEKS